MAAPLAVLLLFCSDVASAARDAQRPVEPDEIIIIDDGDDSPPPSARKAEVAGDKGGDAKSGEGDIIVIEDPDEGPRPETPPVTGALGRLWETWHVGADSALFGGVQLVDPADGPFRMLGSVWLESWLLPAPNLKLYSNGFGRVAIDGTPRGRLVPIVDLYEAYAKINVGKAAVNLGRVVVPWGRTLGAALGDRVNPPDYRRGEPFPDPARQKQPMWGGLLRTSVGSLGVEGVVLTQYEDTEGSLAAANQGGVRIARYQTALVRSPARAGGLLADDDTSSLLDAPVFVQTSTLAARAWRRVGDVDISGSVVWGYDETPRLHLRPDVARALASELLAIRPGAVGDLPLPCGDDISLGCVGGSGTLAHDRTTSFSLDASWGLGVVVVRAEAVAYPNAGGLGGKSAILADDLGLRTIKVTQAAAALAVEGQLGRFVDGSLELFDVVWDRVPAGSILWGVEPLSNIEDANARQVHRVAAGAVVGGSLLDERMHWRVRGEAGVLQPDLLVSAELRYILPVFGMYVGGRTDLFTGVAGSPGWFRQDASLVGVFLGEGS